MSASRFARAMSASRRTLDRLDVDQTLVAKLENRGCRTAEDALHRAPLDVVELADCSHRRARDFIISVAKAVAPTPTTAFDALRRSKFVPTTLREIDAALGGGLSVGLSALASGLAIGVTGNVGVKGIKHNDILIAVILLMIFAEAIALYGFIVAIVLVSA